VHLRKILQQARTRMQCSFTTACCVSGRRQYSRMDRNSKTEPVPFVIYADFESFLVPGSNDKLKNAIDTHIPSGFCCFTVSKYEKYNNQPPKLYSGPNVMDHFYNHLIKEKERINEILQNNEPMKPLTLQQQISHDNATSCITCHKPFTPENHKVRHHCHVTGEYIGPTCNNCNLQLKPRHVSSGSGCRTHTEHFIPVVLHNLKNYDSHIILKEFKRIAAERKGYRHSCHRKNSERYISFASTVFASSILFNSCLLLLINSFRTVLSTDTTNLFTCDGG
jgi:hypothetical protein